MHKKKKPSKPKICWDTCVFLALFGEECESCDLGLVQAVASKIDSGHADLMFSVTTFSELLDFPFEGGVDGETYKRKLKDWSQRSNISPINVDLGIADLASELRTHGKNEGRKLTTPDMQIVATAMIYKADVLHTLDKKILQLNGKPYLGNLKITVPSPVVAGQSLWG